MHFMVTAPGYRRVITHLFVSGDPYLESDAVFGVKASLITPFERVDRDGETWRAAYDFVLQAE